ncbi:MAG: hypothetical protein BRC29_02660 [Nanohaloarchaea archaeon SW_7_43_1]|nr:MAG: hypothetical protein BRC29_02660 [Nanohaloarchaea archaeon SW_7_43_1]
MSDTDLESFEDYILENTDYTDKVKAFSGMEYDEAVEVVEALEEEPGMQEVLRELKTGSREIGEIWQGPYSTHYINELQSRGLNDIEGVNDIEVRITVPGRLYMEYVSEYENL